MRRLLVLLANVVDVFRRLLFTHISPLCILQEAEVDSTAAISSGVRFYRGSLGRYSYISNNSYVTDCRIGSFTSISSDCYIGGTSHPLEWVSTSPVFHRWGNLMKKNFARHDYDIFCRTEIGNDVWIGNRVMVKAGVHIADGAVIGMGSIVTKDVGPYEIWAGNPARFIRRRMPEETARRIAETAWWDWDDARITETAQDFTDPDAFVRKYHEE